MNFSRLDEYLERIDRNQIPYCEFIIMRNHEKLYEYRFEREDCKGEFEKHDLYNIFSVSKVFLASAVMRLVEREKLNLDDPVSKYIPTFADIKVVSGNDKTELMEPVRPVTIRHLLSMSSGMTYDLKHPEILRTIRENSHASTYDLACAMGRMPLMFQPGDDYLYSLGHDVLAAVVEVVSGMDFSTYMKKEIFQPLGLENIGYRECDFDQNRVHTHYRVNQTTFCAVPQEMPLNEYRLTDLHDSGGAGILTTANDAALFMDALASGSGKDGYVVLKKDTLKQMAQNQLTAKGLETMWKDARWTGIGYGLGVRALTSQEMQSTVAPYSEIGWDGAAGAYCSIDPESGISSFFAMQVMNPRYTYNSIHRAIRNLTYLCLEES